MKIRLLVVLFALLPLTGCSALKQLTCAPRCEKYQRISSSLVDYLYPSGGIPPQQDAMPELRLPLRIGLTFLPIQSGTARAGLDAVRKDELMERIRQRFAARSFVADISFIPDYYLGDRNGFSGLAGLQRLYNVDLLALVSYDQETHLSDNEWSLTYLTIVGAYVVKGSRHDVSTLVDLAVIDPETRALVLRAGGTDTRRGNSTLLEQKRDAREASGEAFAAATEQMIDNFDAALKKFQADVRDGKARVRVVNRNGTPQPSGGGGALDLLSLAMLACLWGCKRLVGR